MFGKNTSPKNLFVCPKKGITPKHSYSFRMGLEPEKSYSIRRGRRILREVICGTRGLFQGSVGIFLEICVARI